jgi:tubulin beta
MKQRENFPDRLLATYSVYPSPKVSDVVVEPYNATLSIHVLLENSDETFVIDNEALYNISHNVLKQNQPKYADLNWVISLVMSGITASLRFPGKLNGDLRKMGVNLVPFPLLHFFLIAQAPLFSPSEAGKVNLTVQELTDQMWSSRNFLANVKPEDGKYMCASCGYRETYQLPKLMTKLRRFKLKCVMTLFHGFQIILNQQSSVLHQMKYQ